MKKSIWRQIMDTPLRDLFNTDNGDINPLYIKIKWSKVLYIFLTVVIIITLISFMWFIGNRVITLFTSNPTMNTSTTNSTTQLISGTLNPFNSSLFWVVLFLPAAYIIFKAVKREFSDMG